MNKIRTTLFLGLIWLIPCMSQPNCPVDAPIKNDESVFYQIVPGPHQVRLVDDGALAMQLRLDMIERAHCFILLEYIIYYTDEAGRMVAQALIEKKRKHPHVRIRLLLDAPPPVWVMLDDYHVSQLIKNGIEVRYYNPGWNLRTVTHRNHRKLFMTEQEAITGGRNIGNHYFDLSDAFNFDDREIWLKGPGLRALAEVFEVYWHARPVKTPKWPLPPDPHAMSREPLFIDETQETGLFWPPTDGGIVDKTRFLELQAAYTEKKNRALDFITPNDRDRFLKTRIYEIASLQSPNEPTFLVDTLSFISDHPDFHHPNANVTGLAAYPFMRTARDSVWLENGYFIPQKAEKRMIRELLANNVQVRLLTNSRASTNEFAPNTLTQWRAKELGRSGLKTWLYFGKIPTIFLPDTTFSKNAVWTTHAKTILVDNRDTWIGTMNFDPRSIRRLNAEMSIIVHNNPVFAQHVSSHIYERLAQARPMNLYGPDARERLKSAKQWFKVLFLHFGVAVAESQF
ncbi:MAG: phosphatidylserine/phosphatidylglycerophosphate/cardiolipin synthase family protein [Rhodothermia bacterium]|nr:phosphatidylserine/phosphatidylglycerophosphate/cardiolipin synthase family protein [Rhodothermia bacterium]